MSQIQPTMHRKPVETDDRRSMTPARKERIWKAWDERCWFCRMPVPMTGPSVVYDHVDTLWIKGSDDDKDIGPIHAATCNKVKTAADLKRIAKTKRQTEACKVREPDEVPVSRMVSRPFNNRWTKGVNDKVRPRKQRQKASQDGGEPREGALQRRTTPNPTGPKP